MAQPFLALQHRSGGAPQVYRLPGVSPQALGDPIGAAVEGTSSDDMCIFNRVIQFQGDVYAAVKGGVYKKDDPTTDTGAWSLDHAFTNFTTSSAMEHAVSGIYQFVDNGVEKLFVCWRADTSNSTWNASILDGSTGLWSDAGEQAAVTAGNNEATGAQIIYRGVLYWGLRTSQEFLTFDPVAQSLGTISAMIADEIGSMGLCVFNDRLLTFGRNSSGNAALFELTSTFNELLEVSPAITLNGGMVEALACLVPSPDGSVLYGIVVENGSGSHFLKFIDTAGVISFDSDLTSTVLPAARRPGMGDNNTETRWWAAFDQETTPGSATLLIYFSGNGSVGTTVTQYQFVNESTELSQVDVGGSAAWGFSTPTTGGGERIFTPGELHISIVQRLAAIGGEAVRFKCYGDPGAVNKNVSFRFNTENEVPLTQATLIGTPSVISGGAAAPTRVGDTLQGVEADGVSVYETIWDITADGVTAGQRAQLVPRIFI